MNHRRVIACALTGLVVAALAAGPATSASAKPTKPAAKPGHSAAPKRWLGGHRSAQTVRTARRPAPPPHVPRLDPRLQTVPAGAGGTVEVDVRGDAQSVGAAINKVGGRSIAVAHGARTAVVPRSALSMLAAAPGVAAVDQPVRAFTDSTSEGVAASNAQVWQAAGQSGAGAAVGIADGGFANLSSEITAGNLPASLVHYVDDPTNPANQNHCADENNSDHGTAVTEIIHQMAPGADLYLYCIDNTTGFAQAEQQIQSAGNIKIVNSSLGFPGDSRGDGTGDPSSAAATVKTARQAGILWIQSAGNNGLDHWTGTLKDADHDGLVDINGTTCTTSVCNEWDGVFVSPGSGASLVLKWDDWPTVPTAVPLTLMAYGAQCVDAACTSEQPLNNGDPITASQQAGQPPVLHVDVSNDSAFDQEWDVYLSIGVGVPAVSYDLSYWGGVSGSYLSGLNAARAAADSVTEPADSPYALAAGAVDVHTDTTTGGCDLPEDVGASYPLEAYSSQGPTIDGRVKPDIAGFDNVTSNLSDLDPFCGTSAAAPHVAGAAALVAAANPTMDAAQLQNFLEQRANSGSPNNPPDNEIGHGVLNLGAASGIAPPAAYGYHALAAPKRVVTAFTMGAGQSHVFAIPTTAVPAGAAAVALNVTAITKTGNQSYVSLLPANSTFVDTATLNVNSTDVQTEELATVPLFRQQVQVHNSAGTVVIYLDVMGYYGGASATSKYTAVTGVRLLNTASTLGNHHRKLNNGETILLDAGSSVPSDATAAVVNVMAYNPTGVGYLTASGTTTNISTLRYIKHSRANLAITPLIGHKFRLSLAGTPSDAIVDLVGYFSNSTGASYVPLPSPVRVVSTLTGNGLRRGTLGATTATMQGSKIFDVAYGATALASTVWALPASGGNYMTLYPNAVRPPQIATMAFSAGRNVSNAVMGGLDAAGQTKIENASGTVNVAIDLSGYFI